MSQQSLREALQELGSDVPAPASPPDLWARGKRRVRATRALVACVVLGVGLGASAGIGLVVDAGDPAPIAQVPEGDHALPDRVYLPDDAPSAETFPPGRVAALLDDGLVGSEQYFVVSAVDRSYRELVPPERAPLSLSPDGRFIVLDPGGGDRSATQVYDAATGMWRALELSEARSSLGLASMGWLEGSTLVVASSQGVVRLVDVASGLSQRVPRWRAYQLDVVPGFLTAEVRGRLQVVDPSTGNATTVLDAPPDLDYGFGLSPELGRLAVINAPRSMLSGEFAAEWGVTGDGAFSATRLGSAADEGDPVWIDEDTVVVDDFDLIRHEVDTGESARVVTRATSMGSLSVARDLLDRPTTSGVDPRPRVERSGVVVVGLVGVLLLVAGLGALAVRRWRS